MQSSVFHSHKWTLINISSCRGRQQDSKVQDIEGMSLLMELAVWSEEENICDDGFPVLPIENWIDKGFEAPKGVKT